MKEFDSGTAPQVGRIETELARGLEGPQVTSLMGPDLPGHGGQAGWSATCGYVPHGMSV